DPSLVPFEASFRAVPDIADRLVYTGYVADDAPNGEIVQSSEGAEILVSAGGGPAGYALLRAAIGARRLSCLDGASWRLLAGAGRCRYGRGGDLCAVDRRADRCGDRRVRGSGAACRGGMIRR